MSPFLTPEQINAAIDTAEQAAKLAVEALAKELRDNQVGGDDPGFTMRDLSRLWKIAAQHPADDLFGIPKLGAAHEK